MKIIYGVLVLLVGLIIGVSATTYSTSSFEGTGMFSASDTKTGLSGDYGGIGDFRYRSVSTQDGEHNETSNVQFVMDTAEGADKFTYAHVNARDHNGPTSSTVWASRSDYISIVATSNVSDSSLATQVEVQGNMDLWVVGKTFDKSWKASSVEVDTVRNGTNLTVSLYRAADWGIAYVDPDWLCSDCEQNIGEVQQPVSPSVKYNASRVAYAGIGSAYAAQNVVSSGLQGNGTKLG